MRVKTFSHPAHEDGTLKCIPGYIIPKLKKSAPGGGCGMASCGCKKEFWLSVCFPRREDGTFNGFHISCDTEEELDAISVVKMAQSLGHTKEEILWLRSLVEQ